MRGRWVGVGLLATAACSADPRSIEPPGDDPWVLVIDDGGALSATVVGDVPLSIGEVSLDAELIAVASPAAASLPSGSLTVGVGCRLLDELEPSRVYVRSVEAGWVERANDDVPAVLMDLEIELGRPCRSSIPCPRLEIASHPLPRGGDVTWAIGLADSTVLFGVRARESSAQATLLVDGQGEVTEITRVPDIELWSAWVDTFGELWFGGADGTMHRGALDTTQTLNLSAETPPLSTSPDPVFMIAGGELEANRLDLLVLTEGGQLARFSTDAGWGVLESLGPSPASASAGGLAELRAGEVLVGWSESPRLLWYKDGVVHDISPPGLDEGITALADIPGVGPVFSTGSSGELYLQDGERSFYTVPELRHGGALYALVGVDGGVLAGGATGALRVIVPGRGLCAPIPGPARSIRSLIDVGGGRIIALGDGPSDGRPASFHIVSQ